MPPAQLSNKFSHEISKLRLIKFRQKGSQIPTRLWVGKKRIRIRTVSFYKSPELHGGTCSGWGMGFRCG
ncbi:unnamed protein product [Ectocarpus sp. CCAP 1310/34]|nr:unnamed protein product [Ectocarpus sp. CCAP 1310/34]